jgi:hypothetical protein
LLKPADKDMIAPWKMKLRKTLEHMRTFMAFKSEYRSRNFETQPAVGAFGSIEKLMN